MITIAIGIALFARFSDLETTPDHLPEPEEMLSQVVHDVVTSGWIGLWSIDLSGQPTGVAYFMAVWVRAVGEDIVVLRFVVAATGLVTIAMLFTFCRRFLGLRSAVFSTMLLAFSAWHIEFSRIALPAAFLPIFGLTTFHLVVSGLEDADLGKGLRNIFLGGVMAGLGLYVHNAFWLIVIAVGVLWAWEFLSGESPIEVVSRKAMFFWVPVLMVALPYLSFLVLNWAGVVDYLREVSVTGLVEFQDKNGLPGQSRYLIAEWARSSMVLLDRFDIVSATLAVVGLAVGVTRLRQRSYVLLWALVATTTLAVALTVDAGVYSRMMPALPAVLAMAGVGMDWMLTWTKGRFILVAQYAIVTLAILFIAWTNLTSFYNHSIGQKRELLAVNTKFSHRCSISMAGSLSTEFVIVFPSLDQAPLRVEV